MLLFRDPLMRLLPLDSTRYGQQQPVSICRGRLGQHVFSHCVPKTGPKLLLYHNHRRATPTANCAPCQHGKPFATIPILQSSWLWLERAIRRSGPKTFDQRKRTTQPSKNELATWPAHSNTVKNKSYRISRSLIDTARVRTRFMP